MRKLLTLILMALSVLSCGPTRHAIHVEMRNPSKSGLELGGKNITVAYSLNGDQVADSFNLHMAKTFAELLEKDYFTGEGSVPLYNVDASKGDYSQKDSLINILSRTDADVVFLIDSPQFQQSASAAVPLKIKLYCYDGMNEADKVFAYTGSKVVILSDESAIMSEAIEAGKLVAASFISQWKHEQYSVVYFDGAKWYEALAHAEQYDWIGAMDIWFSLLDTDDLMKRASAEFNISVACYMLGDYILADEWLKKSKADNDMPTLTDAMSKRIDAMK